jgi:hypothetical protein
LFENHEYVIAMDDDIATSPGFLTFMNEAFRRYGTDARVMSITGYCPPISIPDSYPYDAFFLGRMSGWGCGLIKDKYYSVLEISQNEFDEFAGNEALSRAFVENGDDLMVMLRKVAYGLIDAWDVRCMYTQFRNLQVTVYPTRSLVQNIGFDGTGIHCGKTTRFNVKLSDKTEFVFPDEIAVDPQIVSANRQFRNTKNAKLGGKAEPAIRTLGDGLQNRNIS